MVKMLNEYFQIIDDETVQDNFVLIYELLDESTDFGFPQLTDATALKEVIYTGDLKKNATAVTKTLTTKPTFRKENVKYWFNSLYVEVVERIDLLVCS